MRFLSEFLRKETETYEKVLRETMVVLPEENIHHTDLNNLKSTVQRLRKSKKELLELTRYVNNLKVSVEKAEEAVQSTHCDVQSQLHFVMDHFWGLERKYQTALIDYQYISKRNAWNDLFYIYIDNDFGNINDVALGITDPTNINFEALNYALGDCVLLLHCLSRIIQFKYYRPMPFGRQSYFIDSSKTRFNLHFDKSNWSWRSNINNGMKALVVCMKEIEMKYQLNSGIPGKIDLNKGCISKYSWNFPSNPQKEDQRRCWNKACRYILSNLKIYLHKLSTES